MSDERAFLHSIASPITSVFFLAEMTLENMQAHSGSHPEDIARMKKIMESLVQLEKMLAERRQTLLKP